ncbi:hypothetical protein ACFQRL_13765 [Microbacterium fluvii]|uniref:Bacterial Ig-like domain-containing protein n=1 Tax=Microbacterium fluvii TaxID=415215 RepID=A0ABW2HGC5_9MICO|nr:hypothetical protein [Microbacterium fluvii]MCU4673658.1 hypothetical protein [Microbacterium fluvii]
MKKTSVLRAGAVALVAALFCGAAPAYADEVDPSATLSLGAAGVLTLPDADGVRDATEVTVSSTAPTTATVTVASADGLTLYAQVGTVELTEQNGLTAAVAVPVTGLPAGALSVVATPTTGEASSTGLTVGSGAAVTASLSLSRSTIYTWSKSTRHTTTVSVAVEDETGLAVPFTGTVTAKVGSSTKSVAVAAADASTATATLSASKLAHGSGTVSATVVGAGEAAITSAARALTVSSVALKSTKLAASAATLYPTKDGYRDSAKLSVSSTTTTGGSIPTTGGVTITRGGKTVASWKLSSSKAWSATWNGKVGGKVVAGTYKVTVSIKGPEGKTQSASKTITVKKGKLVTKKTSKWVSAKSVIKKYANYDFYDQGYCGTDWAVAGDVMCIGYDDQYDGVMSLYATGALTVPSAVVKAEKYGSAKVRLTIDTIAISGDVVWGYRARGKQITNGDFITRTGTSTRGWSTLPTETTKVDVGIGLGEYSYVAAKRFKVEYAYKVMTGTK